jgi:hypothetical protein
MGVDICTWRAKIGCFSQRKSPMLRKQSRFADYVCLANSSAGRSLLPCLGALWLAVYLGITRTALPVLLLLLIIAGVELNPGPASVTTATCGLCELSTDDNTLACHFCSQSIHLQCITDRYVHSNGTNLKNSKSWFYGFFQHSPIFFICDHCLPRCAIITHASSVDNETQTSTEEPLCVDRSSVTTDQLVTEPSASILTADIGVNTDDSHSDDDSCSVIFSGVPFCSVSSDKNM